MLSLFLVVLAQSWTSHCTLGIDAVMDAGSAIVCDIPINAPRYASTSSPHHDNLNFRANSPAPLFATVNSENGDWDFGDTSGVTEVHGFVESTSGGSYHRGAVELYCNNLDGGYVSANNNNNSCIKYGNGPSSTAMTHWTPVGDYYTTGGTFNLGNDNNEKHITSTNAAGTAYTSRLHLQGSDPSGGPSVYIAKDVYSAGDIFQILGISNVESGFTAESGIRTGKVSTLPTCNASREGVIHYDNTNKVFKGCNGTSWITL